MSLATKYNNNHIYLEKENNKRKEIQKIIPKKTPVWPSPFVRVFGSDGRPFLTTWEEDARRHTSHSMNCSITKALTHNGGYQPPHP